MKKEIVPYQTAEEGLGEFVANMPLYRSGHDIGAFAQIRRYFAGIYESRTGYSFHGLETALAYAQRTFLNLKDGTEISDEEKELLRGTDKIRRSILAEIFIHRAEGLIGSRRALKTAKKYLEEAKKMASPVGYEIDKRYKTLKNELFELNLDKEFGSSKKPKAKTKSVIKK